MHAQHLRRYLGGQGYSMTLKQNFVRPITSLFKVGPYYFTEMIPILRRRVASKIWVATLKVKVTASSAKSSPANNFVIWSWIFQNILQKCSPYWDDVSPITFGSLPWRSRWKHELKSDFINISQKWSPYRDDARKHWVDTLKVKVTAWPCSKMCPAHNFCYLKSDFTNISQKWSPYGDDVSIPCPLFGSVRTILHFTK